MEHFYQNIQGWFNFKNFYSEMAKNLKDGDHYVEVGAWKGQSAAFMATEIANSGKTIKFDVVDTWKGSLEHQIFGMFKDDHVVNNTLYEHFLENMKPVEGYYNPIRMSSVEAAQLYEDNSLDWVMIDASHDYGGVMEDIMAWLPKVKNGGILAGDDYCEGWEEVIHAVNDYIPSKTIDGSTWVHIKGT